MDNTFKNEKNETELTMTSGSTDYQYQLVRKSMLLEIWSKATVKLTATTPDITGGSVPTILSEKLKVE